MLYLISTPIGNLGDFSFRAIEAIKTCDYLLCEDTRKSGILLKRYEIKRPMKSFHVKNEKQRGALVLSDLAEGNTIGLLSDAGTPGISDPGNRLIELCLSQEIKVEPIPGPSAFLVALSGSGLDMSRFQFIGFLPKKKGKITTLLEEAALYPGTTIAYESPYRLVKTLEIAAALNPSGVLVVARELTKKFETFKKGSAEELLLFFKERGVKGEIVLLIQGRSSK